MTEPGQRLSLDTFLADRAPALVEDLGAEAARVRDIAAYLARPLGRWPDLAAQVERLGKALPPDIETATDSARLDAVAEAEHLVANVKQRWIDADDPPLVGEIDDRLAEITTALATLRQPGADAVRAAAAEIDRLNRQHDHLDGIERKYLPWAGGALILFLLGIWLLINPGLLAFAPGLASFWTIIACLAALPVTGFHYSRKVLPRSRADHQIDQLNRKHFVPLNGLYFPQSDTPACVITIAPPAIASDGAQAREDRRRHRDKANPTW